MTTSIFNLAKKLTVSLDPRSKRLTVPSSLINRHDIQTQLNYYQPASKDQQETTESLVLLAQSKRQQRHNQEEDIQKDLMFQKQRGEEDIIQNRINRRTAENIRKSVSLYSITDSSYQILAGLTIAAIAIKTGPASIKKTARLTTFIKKTPIFIKRKTDIQPKNNPSDKTKPSFISSFCLNASILASIIAIVPAFISILLGSPIIATPYNLYLIFNTDHNKWPSENLSHNKEKRGNKVHSLLNNDPRLDPSLSSRERFIRFGIRPNTLIDDIIEQQKKNEEKITECGHSTTMSFKATR